jgi:apolipoprotein D and lipocalin family protein
MKLFSILFALLCSLPAAAELKTVPFVDPALYGGTWYQIARNPHPFEVGCVCARQVLTVNGLNDIGVYNSCNKNTPTGPLMEIRGVASVDNPGSNSQLTVDLGLPRKGQYWIIALADDYSWAVVSEPSLQTLYVLSKTPTLPEADYKEAVLQAATQLDTSRLSKTLQEGCSYPPAATLSPAQVPTDPAHPGSKSYAYGFARRDFTCNGRSMSVFVPTGGAKSEKFPAVVYGHGQALGVENYLATFEHLAKKGVAVIYPTYDTGFFDQDWSRMGRDYGTLTACALDRTPEITRDQLVFSGHSKGAYVASIAAGLAVKENIPAQPRSTMLFATAGFDSTSARHMGPNTSLTVIFSDQDTVVERQLSDSIFREATASKKQFIVVKSYPSGAKADHFWPLTKASFVGGGNESALHYHGSWKWLVAAALDLKAGGNFNHPYLFGDNAADKGQPGLNDDIQRNW